MSTESKPQADARRELERIRTAEGRVIFTQDTDFLLLANSGVAHAGIVYTPQHAAVGDIIRGLLLIHQVLEAEEMVNQIAYL